MLFRSVSQSRYCVGETKNELSVDEAILPEGDFKLYLMPAKTKSGVDFDEMEDTLYRIENKLDRVLSKLDNVSCEGKSSEKVCVANTISAEDQREINELKRLAAGGSTSEWDD